MEQRRRDPRKKMGWGERGKEGGTYQSSGHGGLVVLGKMLLQGQDNAVGNDGGQDHVLKWRGKQELRNTFTEGEDTASEMAVHLNTHTRSTPAASVPSA